MFLHRLMFVIRFAEFHQRRASGDGQGAAVDVVAMFREDIVPQAWWAVLLCDAVELLQNGASVLQRGLENERLTKHDLWHSLQAARCSSRLTTPAC